MKTRNCDAAAQNGCERNEMDATTRAALSAELDRGDRWHARLQGALDRTQALGSTLDDQELSLELRYGVLPPGEFRAELERELARTRGTREQLGIIDVEIEGALSLEETEALYRGLGVMVNRPGDLIGRTEHGVRMLFPWSDSQTAQSLAAVAAGIASHELPERTVIYGFQLNNGRAPLQEAAMRPVPARSPVVYRSRGR